MGAPDIGDQTAGVLTILTLVAALALAYRPLGDFMAHTLTSRTHTRFERPIYRLLGVDPDSEQSTRAYVLGVVGFSTVSLLGLYLILVGQSLLPYSRGMNGMPWEMAFNTAASFVTNTNWQSYAGESTLGFTAQMAGLAVQNFVSAAVGVAIAVALIRAFTRKGSGSLGNFWVDLVRINLRILLPVAFVAAVVLVAAGAVQDFGSDTVVDTITGHQQTIVGGPVASQEAIKELGTNGGGFFNANSAHPFENPNAFSNLVEIFLILLIPVALTRTLGTILGKPRQGYAVLGAMTVLWFGSLAITTWAEVGTHSQAAQAAGASMEGKETQFGTWASSLFAVATTGTSTGAVNSAHDSLTPTGGGTVLANMMLGEVSPGGVGTGMYGILVMAILAVFVAGLMVGRTPEFLGKKIGATEMKYVALYALTTPAVVLVGVGIAIGLGSTPDAMGNPGGHGFSEVVYAYTSAGNNNGSAFGGITVTSTFFQVSLGFAMLIGRFVPIVLVLLLAGSLARQGQVPETRGTLPTHTPLFAGFLVGVIVLLTGLTYFPALSLGPIAEALA
ncbi:potassium-transporting ATPase subunit KdpA [Solicola gregarius]|uniref:Potassium-transporting ATPase potassium-binding subunit n=1 Tax=Solicola gregarius TaxID=2908642 RepID=A0AA46TFY0_9ACTN|nr:potassium-transporting ATPase subunit KdpA [Solicola gregarius]UYM04591.1 potassium-transporting ATPase subunit KdpA [Solicola gregarius]